MLYRSLRALLFRLSPDRAQTLAVGWLRLSSLFGSTSPPEAGGMTLMGLRFANPIGLAAGFDKSARHIDALARLGFGFIEVGTVTPRPQRPSPPPNLFRLVEDRALINRMGFNNDGVEAVVKRLEKRRYGGVCGVNIGKNRDTPLEDASRDYVICLRAVYATADYVTVNVSSPNTPGLRTLQRASSLEALLRDLANERESLAGNHRKRVPMLVKVAPDLGDEDLEALCRALRQSSFDGVVATNTTTARPSSLRSRQADEAGGLSGEPLHERSLRTIRGLRRYLGSSFPIVGVGGICDVSAARATFAAGADLIQLYTGLIYAGPVLVRRLIRDAALREDSRPPRSVLP